MSVPSWVTYVSTRLISFVEVLTTLLIAYRDSISSIFFETSDVVIPVSAVLLNDVKSTNPIDVVPIPKRSEELALVLINFKS